MESINRAFFNITYNEKASQAYDEQSEKAVSAVEGVKKQIDGYRNTRDKIIRAGESTDYFSSNSIARITEWENWLSKNGSLASGDYTKKSTEMKTQWDSILGANKTVKEMSRVAPFIDLYIKDKDTTLPIAQKKELDELKKEATAYYEKIVKETPADIVAKRDEFNRKFEAIQKKLPENFEDINTSYTTAINFLSMIEEQNYQQYEKDVKNRELAEQDTFRLSRLVSRIVSYFFAGLAISQQYFFGSILAVLAMNDAIARPVLYRIFYGAYMMILCTIGIIPYFPFIALGYYIYRALSSMNLNNYFSGDGPLMDYVSAPVLFALIPLFEGGSITSKIPLFHYNPNAYDGVIEKKKRIYLEKAAALVGASLSDETPIDKALCDLKSAVLGVGSGTFQEAVDGLKESVA